MTFEAIVDIEQHQAPNSNPRNIRDIQREYRTTKMCNLNNIKDDDDDEYNVDANLEAVRYRHYKYSKKKRPIRNSSSNNINSKYSLKREKVQAGDTVQSLAVKYSVPPALIKSANKLYNDQEIYSLFEINIPILSHGILSETIESEDQNRAKSTADSDKTNPATNRYYNLKIGDSYISDSADADIESSSDQENRVQNVVGLKSALKWKHNTHTLLDQLDQNLANIRASKPTLKSHLDYVALDLNKTCIYPININHNKTENERNFKHSIYIVVLIAGVIGVSLLCLIVFLTNRILTT